MTTTTTVPGQQPPPPAEPLPPVGPGSGDDTAAPPSGGFPPELQAKTDSVKRTAPNGTDALFTALAPLAQYGLTPEQIIQVGFGRFPVAGPAHFIDDWWFPRFGPGWRLHEGTDMFAAYGTPVRAPVDGRVRITNGGLGGLSVYVVQPDGIYYYMTHLSAVAPGLTEGMSVTTGQIVGNVGTSGNAAGGAAHLHFGIYLANHQAINPKPILDQFLADAVAMAPRIIYAYAAAAKTGAAPAPVVVPAPKAPDLSLALTAPPRSALLWASSVNPAGGALQLAEAEAQRAADAADVKGLLARQRAAVRARAAERARVRAWVDPLLPRMLRYAIDGRPGRPANLPG